MLRHHGPSPGWHDWFAPFLLALSVGSWQIGRPGVWRDEVATWWSATVPVGALVDMSRETDAVGFLYYLGMHAWVAVLGSSPVALRLPSLLAMAAAAAVTAAVGRRLFNGAAGAVAGVLLALSAATTRYGQEARVYAWVALMVAVATLLLLRALDTRTPGAFGAYAVAVALVGWLHVFALVMLAGHAAAVAASPERAVVGRRWAASVAAACVVVSPVAIVALSQRGQVSWLPDPTPRMFGYAVRLWFGTAAATTVVLAAALLGCRRDAKTALLLGWGALAPFALYAGSYVTPMFTPRYITFALPTICLLAGAGLTRVGQRWRWGTWGTATIVVAAVVALSWGHHRQIREPAFKDGFTYEELVEPITAGFRLGDAVAFAPSDAGYAVRLGAEYQFDRSGIDPVEAFEVVGDHRYMPAACADVSSCRPDADRVWVVRRRMLDDPLSGLAPAVEAILRTDFVTVDSYHTAGGRATVALLERRPPTGE